MSRDNALSAVFDCMVYLQTAINETGPAGELLPHAERGNISLFVRREILQELRDVIATPEVVDKHPYLNAEFAEAFLILISQTASFIKSFQTHFSFSAIRKTKNSLTSPSKLRSDIWSAATRICWN